MKDEIFDRTFKSIILFIMGGVWATCVFIIAYIFGHW
jgi:hypothetical protein